MLGAVGRLMSAVSCGTAFTPLALFAAGEQGVWYDPSDMTTLFQDSAGTTPVTAVEQPVGLVLDKSKGGVGTNGAKRVNLLNYTEQFDNAVWTTANASVGVNATTAPNGTVTADFIATNTTNGQHSISQNYTVTGGVNYRHSVYLKKQTYSASVLLTDGASGAYLNVNLATGSVYSSGTFGSGYTVVGTPTVVSASNGFYLCTIDFSRSTTASIAIRSLAFNESTGSSSFAGNAADGYYVWGADLRLLSDASVLPTYQPITADWPSTMSGNHATQSTSASRPVLSARYNLLVGTATLATQSATTVATTYILSFSGAGSITLSGTKTGTYSAGSNTLTGVTAGTLTLTVSGTVTNADLRVSNDGVGIPAYQRVDTSTSYDTSGFPMYLKFDGVDDFLVTGNIVPGIDKVQAFAGFRKLSDAAQSLALEFSAASNANNGCFALTTGNSSLAAAASWAFRSHGTTLASGTTAVSAASYAAPVTSVLSGLGDISGDIATLRVNGSLDNTNTADQGTGNFLTYPLYIGRRGGTTAPFAGNIFGIIVRFGASLSASQISNTETWVNSRTKAY